MVTYTYPAAALPPAAVPVSVVHDDCGEDGSDHPVTGRPQCILMREITSINAQAVSDKIFDSKQNPYEPFTNPPNRFMFLSYIVLLLLLLCIVAVFTSSLAKIRKHTILVFAFILILLLALLQKRDDRVLQYDQ